MWLKALGSVTWPLKCWGVTAMQCASFERTRQPCAAPARPLSAKVITEEFDFCYMWLDCLEDTENTVGSGKPQSTQSTPRPTGTFMELDRL